MSWAGGTYALRGVPERVLQLLGLCHERRALLAAQHAVHDHAVQRSLQLAHWPRASEQVSERFSARAGKAAAAGLWRAFSPLTAGRSVSSQLKHARRPPGVSHCTFSLSTGMMPCTESEPAMAVPWRAQRLRARASKGSPERHARREEARRTGGVTKGHGVAALRRPVPFRLPERRM